LEVGGVEKSFNQSSPGKTWPEKIGKTKRRKSVKEKEKKKRRRQAKWGGEGKVANSGGAMYGKREKKREVFNLGAASGGTVFSKERPNRKRDERTEENQ